MTGNPSLEERLDKLCLAKRCCYRGRWRGHVRIGSSSRPKSDQHPARSTNQRLTSLTEGRVAGQDQNVLDENHIKRAQQGQGEGHPSWVHTNRTLGPHWAHFVLSLASLHSTITTGSPGGKEVVTRPQRSENNNHPSQTNKLFLEGLTSGSAEKLSYKQREGDSKASVPLEGTEEKGWSCARVPGKMGSLNLIGIKGVEPKAS